MFEKLLFDIEVKTEQINTEKKRFFRFPVF